jgi:hypothetical protein
VEFCRGVHLVGYSFAYKNIPWQAVRKTLMYNTAALIIINVLEKPVNFVVKYKA